MDSRDDEVIGQPPKKIMHHYSSSQKKHVVTMAKKKSIQAASDHFHIPRMVINRWMVNGYFVCNCTQKKNQKGQERQLTYGKVIDEELNTCPGGKIRVTSSSGFFFARTRAN